MVRGKTSQLGPRGPMDPQLIKAFARGRESGIREGKIEATSSLLFLIDDFIEELDQHVKGIGPAKSEAIAKYFAQRMLQAKKEGKIIDSDNEK